MKLGSGTSYWPTSNITPRAISQDVGRVSHITFSNPKPTRKEKTNAKK